MKYLIDLFAQFRNYFVIRNVEITFFDFLIIKFYAIFTYSYTITKNKLFFYNNLGV